MIDPKRCLKISIFIAGFSGIVSEYLLSTLASYLLGDTVFQWSITISIMLLAMGTGARLSKEIPESFLIDSLVLNEILLAMFVSFSVYLCYLQAPFSERISFFIYSTCFIVGILIGFEIPICVRINSSFEELKDNISSILEKDYLGALPGGLLYGYLLLPKLGLLYTPAFIGLLNLSVAGILFAGFSRNIRKILYVPYVSAIAAVVSFTVFAKPIYLHAEQRFYRDPIVDIRQTRYQKIVITKWRNHYLLYLNGHLQLSTVDEKRYHESIVHIPMAIKEAKSVLIIGGGDGCVLREVIKYPYVKRIELVDIDREFVEYSMSSEIMRKINQNSFRDKRVKLYFMDGFQFVKKTKRRYDLAIIDLTDPNNLTSARLYSKEFYSLLYRILSADGIMITQASSPFFARKVFCCILKTVSEAGFIAFPMTVNVPSFGEWGFVLGVKERMKKEEILGKIKQNFKEKYCSYLTKEKAISEFYMEKNFSCSGIIPNTLINPVILRYYEDKLWQLI